MFRHINPKMQSHHGLELSEYFLLQYILETDMSPSGIAETMQMPAHAISRKLDVLEKLELIDRQLHPNDARKRVLSVTAKGRSLLSEARQTLEQEVDTMITKLEPDTLECFLQNLELLAKH